MEYRNTYYRIEITNKNQNEPYDKGFFLDVYGLIAFDEYEIWPWLDTTPFKNEFRSK